MDVIRTSSRTFPPTVFLTRYFLFHVDFPHRTLGLGGQECWSSHRLLCLQQGAPGLAHRCSEAMLCGPKEWWVAVNDRASSRMMEVQAIVPYASPISQVLAGSFVVGRGSTTPTKVIYWEWCLLSTSFVIKDLLGCPSAPYPQPASCELHLTDRIVTSRKQLISLENEKLPLCLIVPQHNLPLPAPGPHPHPLLFSAPWSYHVPGPLLEVWATFCDLWTKWRQGQNTDCPWSPCVVLDIPARRDSSQDMGLNLQQATQSGRGYLSPDKQNSHCFLPALWPRLGSRETAAVVPTP